MKVYLNIGHISGKGLPTGAPAGSTTSRQAKEDQKITVCLCERNWGTKYETLTCQEFLEHCRKLYNCFLEKKKLEA